MRNPPQLPLFQSLIGRLKTAKGYGASAGEGGFQSLIGRLKTIVAQHAIRGVPKFQSLIGRLKTSDSLRDPADA